MNYCLNYLNDFGDLNKQTEEITITHKTGARLDSFLITHKDQKVNLNIRDFQLSQEELDYIAAVAAKGISKQFAIKIAEDSAYLADYTNFFREKNIPFFLDTIAYDAETLYVLVHMGVSEVYIGGELGFKLPQFRPSLENIKIRVYPHIATSAKKEIPAICKFFILPDDTDIYEPYIDTFDLGENLKQDLYYDFYHSSRMLTGNLQDFLIGFDDPDSVNNMFLLDDFAKYRLTCNHTCMLNGICNLCPLAADAARLMEKNTKNNNPA